MLATKTTVAKTATPPVQFITRSLSERLPNAPAMPKPIRIAEGPFRCAGELRPGAFVFLYHRPNADAPGGYEANPAYRLHVIGDTPVSCSCPDKRVTHAREPRYFCKHMKALAVQLAPAGLLTDDSDPFDCEVVIWRMADWRMAGAQP